MLKKITLLVILSACLFIVGCSTKNNVEKSVESPENISKAITGKIVLETTKEVFDIIDLIKNQTGDFYINKGSQKEICPIYPLGENIRKFKNISYVQIADVFKDEKFRTSTGEFYTQINKPGESDGECVSLVKALTNSSLGTSTWRKGIQVTKNNIKKGTAIAIFNVSGLYDSNQHCAIFIKNEYDKSGHLLYVWILDQNWWPGQTYNNQVVSVATLHKLSLTGIGKNNANNYYTITY